MRPDVILFNTLIGAQEWTRSFQLLNSELRGLFQADLITFVAALKRCPWQNAISLMKELPKHALRNGTLSCNALMTELREAGDAVQGQWQSLLNLYNSLACQAISRAARLNRGFLFMQVTLDLPISNISYYIIL